MSEEGINWRLISPASPHRGGMSESGVKCVKHHLKRTIENITLTYEELSTLLVEIEAILNSRPLCAVGDTFDGTNYLTPSHFLIDDNIKTIPKNDVRDTHVNRLSTYRQITHIKQCFWKRWSREYLSTYNQKKKVDFIKRQYKIWLGSDN